MSVIILFGHGMNGVVADALNAFDLGEQVTYRKAGIIRHEEIGESPYLNFTPMLRTPDGIVVAYHGDEPTNEEIDEAIIAAKQKYPWKFIH